MATIREVDHYDGDYDCSATCSGNPDVRHIGDPPADWPQCCTECGGSGHACYPVCTEPDRYRPWEPWEGLTGAEDIGGAVDGSGYVHSDADPGL